MAPSMLDRSPNPTSGEARLLVEDGDPRASHCGTERYNIQAPTGGAKQPQTALHVHHLDGPPLGASRAISTITNARASP